jgi:hypothetical protein
MRHLGSLFLAALLTPVVYLSAGVGLSHFTEITGDHPDSARLSGLVTLGVVLLGGLLYALLTLPRLSPLGPMLAGLALLAVGTLALLRPSQFQIAMPHSVLGLHVTRSAGPVAALLGLPLVLTMFSGRRWRGQADGEEPEYDDAYPYPGAAARGGYADAPAAVADDQGSYRW